MPDIKHWNSFLKTILGSKVDVTRVGDDGNVYFSYVGDLTQLKDLLSSHDMMRHKVLHALRRPTDAADGAADGAAGHVTQVSSNPKFTKLKEVFSYGALDILKHLLSEQWVQTSCLDAFHDKVRYKASNKVGDYDVIAEPINEDDDQTPWVMLHDQRDGVAKYTLTYADDAERDAAASKFKKVQSALSIKIQELLTTLLEDTPLVSKAMKSGKTVEVNDFAKGIFSIGKRGEEHIDITFKYGELLRVLQQEYDPLGEFAPVIMSARANEYYISEDATLLYLGHTFQPPMVCDSAMHPIMFNPPSAAAAAEPKATTKMGVVNDADVTGVLEILLDCSASMYDGYHGSQSMDHFKRAIEPIINAFIDNHNNWVVSVIPFGSRVGQTLSFTDKRPLIDYFNNKLQNLGNTALYDGTRAAFSSVSDYVKKYHNASVGILVVTDGGQNAGNESSPMPVVKEVTARLGGKLQTFLCDVGVDNNEFARMSKELGFEHIKLKDASQLSKLQDWADQMGVPHIVAEFIALGQKLAAMRVAEGDVKSFDSALPKGTVVKIDGKEYTIGTEDLPVVVADTEAAALVPPVLQSTDSSGNDWLSLVGDGLFA